MCLKHGLKFLYMVGWPPKNQWAIFATQIKYCLLGPYSLGPQTTLGYNCRVISFHFYLLIMFHPLVWDSEISWIENSISIKISNVYIISVGHFLHSRSCLILLGLTPHWSPTQTILSFKICPDLAQVCFSFALFGQASTLNTYFGYRKAEERKKKI